jgi:hypothetical protein
MSEPSLSVRQSVESPASGQAAEPWLSIGFLTGPSSPLRDTRIQVIAVFLLGVAVTCMSHPFTRALAGDNSLYVYIAQSIVRGQVPYRDIADIKGPGSAYVSALFMVIARPFGIRGIIADRLAQILMTGLLCSVSFLVGLDYLKNKLGAFFAVAFPLMVPTYAIWMAEGGQPKLSMLLFGMLAMLMISRDRPFWAGWWSMCCCLCWQPGLLFGGTAFLIFSKYLTSWRDKRALKVLIGGASPLAVTLLWFWRIGALKYFWACSFEYAYSVFAPLGEHSPGPAFVHILRIIWRIFGFESIVVACSAAGLIIFIIDRVRARPRLIRFFDCPDIYLDGLAIPPIVYLAFSLINFQAGPDLILFFPFFGLLAAYFLIRVESWFPLKRRFTGSWQKSVAKQWVLAPASALVLIGVLAVSAYNWKKHYLTIEWEQNQFKPASDLLGPNDKVYVHGDVEMLVLLNRPNINSLVLAPSGLDDFIAEKWYGGSYQKILDEMESQAPKVVSLGRLAHVNHREDLEQWAHEHYYLLPVNGYQIYVRKPN